MQKHNQGEYVGKWLTVEEVPVITHVHAFIVDHRLMGMLCRKDAYSTWELPGGGLGPGENHIDALKRELREEVQVVEFDRVIPYKVFQPNLTDDFRLLCLVQNPKFSNRKTDPCTGKVWEVTWLPLFTTNWPEYLEFQEFDAFMEFLLSSL